MRGSQGWRLGKASVGKGVDERAALGVRMSVEGWGVYLEVIKDGGQRGDVGHRVKCGVKGWGLSVGLVRVRRGGGASIPWGPHAGWK